MESKCPSRSDDVSATAGVMKGKVRCGRGSEYRFAHGVARQPARDRGWCPLTRPIHGVRRERVGRGNPNSALKPSRTPNHELIASGPATGYVTYHVTSDGGLVCSCVHAGCSGHHFGVTMMILVLSRLYAAETPARYQS